MQKKYKNAAEKQAAYLQRKKEREETAAERADEATQMKALNLCGFSEVAYDTPARTWLEEVQTHRSWLRAMEQPEIVPGETLRELAKRTWNGLFAASDFGVSINGDDVWYPLFDPNKQDFQVPFDSGRFPGGPLGERIHGAAKPDWFDKHWKPPSDCTGDEIISIEDLPTLPPMKSKRAA